MKNSKCFPLPLQSNNINIFPIMLYTDHNKNTIFTTSINLSFDCNDNNNNRTVTSK